MLEPTPERREYAKADHSTRKTLVKLPGQSRHTESRDSARTIAGRIKLDKAEKRLRKLERAVGR